jgi:hypothetical protein
VGLKGNPSVRVVTARLSLFELLATGVNADVFDLEIIGRMADGRIRAMARNLRALDRIPPQVTKRPLLFAELRHLAKRLERLEGQSDHDPGEGQALSMSTGVSNA